MVSIRNSYHTKTEFELKRSGVSLNLCAAQILSRSKNLQATDSRQLWAHGSQFQHELDLRQEAS